MTVYLLRDPETLGGAGAVKIGFTGDVSVRVRRLRDLQIACAATLEVVSEIPGAGRDIEHALHVALSEHAVRPGGEWFHDHLDVRNAFEAARAGRIASLTALVPAGAPLRDPDRTLPLDPAFGHPACRDQDAARDDDELAGWALTLSAWVLAQCGIDDPGELTEDQRARIVEVVDQADRDLTHVETAMGRTLEPPMMRMAVVAEMAARTTRRKAPDQVKLRVLRPVKEAA